MNRIKLDMNDRKIRVAIMLKKKLTIHEIIIQRNLDFYQRKEKSSKRLRRICEEFDIPIDNFIYK
jgi:hypothetical protein